MRFLFDGIFLFFESLCCFSIRCQLAESCVVGVASLLRLEFAFVAVQFTEIEVLSGTTGNEHKSADVKLQQADAEHNLPFVLGTGPHNGTDDMGQQQTDERSVKFCPRADYPCQRRGHQYGTADETRNNRCPQCGAGCDQPDRPAAAFACQKAAREQQGSKTEKADRVEEFHHHSTTEFGLLNDAVCDVANHQTSQKLSKERQR
ncbi:hypothetical protein T4E_1079 [Trichinella pseudospiralis]|uniref:Secreted protein n=1 Tax=Trichinella pseudospiralis TaxID=6337 RepID=A0A0V0YEP4_TRIPS|nr:hypothetical protein T4E_1079 [Trichinella pseudospiralis]